MNKMREYIVKQNTIMAVFRRLASLCVHLHDLYDSLQPQQYGKFWVNPVTHLNHK